MVKDDRPIVRLDPDEYVLTDEPGKVTKLTGPNSVSDGPIAAYFTLKAGDLAYIDTLASGLIPCKVTTVHEDGSTEVRLTATRPGWNRGEVMHYANPRLALVKRTQVRYRGGQARISGTLRMVTDSGRLV